MSKRHAVTLDHSIRSFNDMFDHMDGIMRAMPENKTPGNEDLFFARK